jgi:alkanesulfonate monooxygenase SsuD/methylene tetrahydromethanopterin reductase-like flavin-dependent oxidoreductase (luciferase family)
MFASFMRQDGCIARFGPSGVIQGRVIFGMGRSDQTCEVETFGASLSGAEANRMRFEEQRAILMEAFDQEAFSHHRNHCTLAPDVPYRGWFGVGVSTS